MNELQDKIVFITASTKGIGYGVAKSVLEKGGRVFIGSRDEKNVSETVSVLNSQFDGMVTGAVLDLSNIVSIKEWIQYGLKKHKKIDHLVINTGVVKFGKFKSLNVTNWDVAIREQILHIVFLIYEIIPFMKSKDNSITSLSSISIKQPLPQMILSNVCRSAVHALIKSLSFELSSDKIRCNSIVLGSINTDRTEHYIENIIKNTNKDRKDIINELISEIPSNRLGSTEEVGALVSSLMMPNFSFINGASIEIDGGFSKSY